MVDCVKDVKSIFEAAKLFYLDRTWIPCFTIFILVG